MIDPEGPYAKREGLITLGVLPQHDAQEAILRSVPRISEAMRLRSAVVARMGDRLVPDVMAGEGNSLLFLRDQDVPEFVIAEALLTLDANVPEPPPLLTWSRWSCPSTSVRRNSRSHRPSTRGSCPDRIGSLAGSRSPRVRPTSRSPMATMVGL